MMEEDLAVFNGFQLLVEGTDNSSASSLPIAFNMATPMSKFAMQNNK